MTRKQDPFHAFPHLRSVLLFGHTGVDWPTGNTYDANSAFNRHQNYRCLLPGPGETLPPFPQKNISTIWGETFASDLWVKIRLKNVFFAYFFQLFTKHTIFLRNRSLRIFKASTKWEILSGLGL